MSFREKPIIKKVPRAGHFKVQGGLPQFSQTLATSRDSISNGEEIYFVQLLDEPTVSVSASQKS